jgi:hypothetical protein
MPFDFCAVHSCTDDLGAIGNGCMQCICSAGLQATVWVTCRRIFEGVGRCEVPPVAPGAADTDPTSCAADGAQYPSRPGQKKVSMQDLMAVELVPRLIEAGVSCFKIEGRLKGPEYVALTTKAYRRAVDIVWDAYLQEQLHMQHQHYVNAQDQHAEQQTGIQGVISFPALPSAETDSNRMSSYTSNPYGALLQIHEFHWDC